MKLFRRSTQFWIVVLVTALVTMPIVYGAIKWVEASDNDYNPHSYSAVFMDNDQVYFGRIQKESRDTIILTNVYYLQTEDIQAGSATARLSLIKLGNELHGPKDKIVINRQHVLFYEEMKNSGVIMDAIISRGES